MREGLVGLRHLVNVIALADRVALALIRFHDFQGEGIAHWGALAGVGKEGRNGEVKPVESEESARLREDAFRHLRRAIELGYADAQRLADDADLAPLRDDPRWTELVSRVRRK